MNIEFLSSFKIFENEGLKELILLKSQGFNNTNYLLLGTKDNYLVRVFGQKKDREFEFKVNKIAYKIGIAQKPFLLDLANNLMISKFTKGEHRYNLSHLELQNLAYSLGKLHNIKCTKNPYNMEDDYKKYSKKPIQYKLFQTNLLFKKIALTTKDYALCHHDLNPKNILFDKNSVKFIDWEYARVNDRYFDLASVIVEFDLNQRQKQIFLKTYFTCKEKYEHEKLDLYIKAYKVMCKLWFHEYLNKPKSTLD